jgi:hypothetical protein
VSAPFMEAWNLHGEHRHGDGFEQCDTYPCRDLAAFERARAVLVEGEPVVTAPAPVVPDMPGFLAQTAATMAAATRTDPAARPTDRQLRNAFVSHRGHPGRYRFEQCPTEPCASWDSSWRSLHANSTPGLAYAYRVHGFDFHEPSVGFAECETGLCPSINPTNRQHWFDIASGTGDGLTILDEDTVTHIAADGLTVHQGYAGNCSVPACRIVILRTIRPPAGVDDSLADLKAAGADRQTFADSRGEPNDLSREG